MKNKTFKLNSIVKIALPIMGVVFFAVAIGISRVIYTNIALSQSTSPTSFLQVLPFCLFCSIFSIIFIAYGIYLFKVNKSIRSDYCTEINIDTNSRCFYITAGNTNIKIPFDCIQSLTIKMGYVTRYESLGHIKLITRDNAQYELTISQTTAFCKELQDEPFFYMTKNFWYKPSWHNQ